MDSQVLAAPIQPASRRRTLAIALLAALAGAAITVGVLVGAGDGSPSKPTATELRGPGFTVAYPGGWQAVPAAKVPEGAVAMLRREDGKGTVVIRAKGAPRDQTLKALTGSLTGRLDRRFPDFRFVSARVTPTRAGNAFLYTFVRTRQKTAQSIALVQAGRSHFTLDSVVSAGDPRAAQEVAAVVRSFGP